MRISRPCYDKMHRCPGWAGGGMSSARVTRCDDGRLRRNGTLEGIYDGRWWFLRLNRCDTCDVVALPHCVRWLDQHWWRWWLRYQVRELRLWVSTWRWR